ncbi:MAG: alpha/beta hydrolase [Pseudomonadales bacterium]
MLRVVLIAILVLLAVAAVWLFEGDIPAAEVDARYSNAASRFLTTPDGARLHYRDQGRRDGLPVVLVHGSNASLHTWEPWVAALGDGYRIITLDLPGHGLTGRVPGDDYGPQASSAAVHEVVEHLGLTRFVLGGNSMGGGVTWRYALDHPQSVRAMILVDASGLWSWRRQETSRTGDTPLAFELLRQPWFRALARYLDPYYLTVQGLRAAYNDSPVVDEALIQRYYQLSLREGTRIATLKRFGGFAGATQDAEPDLSVLTQPTLILWGARDTLIGPEVGQRFHELLPNSQLIVYDDLGHVPMEEDPVRTARDVRSFLAGLQAQGSG